jgi:hypothetical protein
MARLKDALARLKPAALSALVYSPIAFQALSILWWGSGGK